MYLDVMTGGSSNLPEPVAIEEKYLAKIAGMTVDLPTPILIKHKYLAKIAGMTVNVPTYTTNLPRIYAYLAKAAGQDVEVPQPITREEMYWFDYCGGTPTPPEREYTGAVPVTFVADGTPLFDYIISGNTVQNGTPAPDNPIMPQGTGDLETAGAKAGQYKIPILSANTTTPVYLGEVQTTRRIKKSVLTGKETVITSVVTNCVQIDAPDSVQGVTVYSSHFQSVVTVPTETMRNGKVFHAGGAGMESLCFGTNSNPQTFKQWLSDRYSAGTPVTVWYVLATPTTGIVNEPLMKIGDYADTLSMEQAGVEIPTVNGSNTLDVLTTVKPSEVYIKYKGEPVAGSQTSSQSSAYAPAEVSSQSESIDDINSNLLGKEEETE
jgi:hypothetical protein